jgi:hypothetical protein
MKRRRNQKNLTDMKGEGDRRQRDGKLKEGCRRDKKET